MSKRRRRSRLTRRRTINLLDHRHKPQACPRAQYGYTRQDVVARLLHLVLSTPIFL